MKSRSTGIAAQRYPQRGRGGGGRGANYERDGTLQISTRWRETGVGKRTRAQCQFESPKVKLESVRVKLQLPMLKLYLSQVELH